MVRNIILVVVIKRLNKEIKPGPLFMKMTKRNMSMVLLAIVSSLMLQSCYRAWESQPYFEPNPDWQIKEARHIVGPNLDIFINVSNYHTPFYDNTSRKTLYDYLGISLWFDVHEPGFKFNPNDVTLILPGVLESRPSSVEMKYVGDISRSLGWDCGNSPLINAGLAPPYPLRRGSCFALYFYMKAPTPETPFSMHIEGLSRDGSPIEVPEIHFHEGSFWVFEFLGI